MKLFSRGSQQQSEEDFDSLDLPTKDDLADDFFVDEPAPEAPQQQSYGIEEAIALMRTLPHDNDELVVTVVNQTLKSLDIKITDIIKSAEDKEARIRRQHQTLEQEVKELQDKISKHNQAISDLMANLKETQGVKQRLQLALNLEGKATPEKPTTQTQVKNKPQSANPEKSEQKAAPATSTAPPQSR